MGLGEEAYDLDTSLLLPDTRATIWSYSATLWSSPRNCLMLEEESCPRFSEDTGQQQDRIRADRQTDRRLTAIQVGED